uniref:ShTK domain protein n=1 Tax=Angiostrongylus costaricensis TaxID=334426 RepID=A0A0R3PUU5_ANGCS
LHRATIHSITSTLLNGFNAWPIPSNLISAECLIFLYPSIKDCNFASWGVINCTLPWLDVVFGNKVPRVKCETVKKEQCDDPTWKTILAEDCPAVCGLCDQKNPNCRDKITSCKNDVSICRNVDLQDFVKNCQATCGLCGNSTTTTTCYTKLKPTIHAAFSCSSWVANGFCTSTFYTEQQKRQYCGRACNLC